MKDTLRVMDRWGANNVGMMDDLCKGMDDCDLSRRVF